MDSPIRKRSVVTVLKTTLGRVPKINCECEQEHPNGQHMCEQGTYTSEQGTYLRGLIWRELGLDGLAALVHHEEYNEHPRAVYYVPVAVRVLRMRTSTFWDLSKEGTRGDAED